MLERVGRQRGMFVGRSAEKRADRKAALRSVDLDDAEHSEHDLLPEHESANGTSRSSQSLSSVELKKATISMEEFRATYEGLTDQAIRYYLRAGRTRSAERLMGDLATVKFETGDFAGAATYFGRVSSMYADQKWSNIETTMLRMHAECLKKLNRKDEYVRVLLQLLAKSASREKARLTPKVRLPSSAGRSEELPVDDYRWLDDDFIDTQALLAELVGFSDGLPYDVQTPMTDYFAGVVVEPHIRHFTEKDGFQMRLRFRHLLEDDLPIDRASIRLVSTTSGHNREVWVESEEPLVVKRGSLKLWLSSKVRTLGKYHQEVRTALRGFRLRYLAHSW